MKLKKLSELENKRIEDIINELLDGGYDGVINDFTDPPNIEYMIDDLLKLFKNQQ
jgi:hypothetical protein